MGVYIKNITKDDLAENGALMWGKRIIFIPPEDIIPVQDHGDLIDRDALNDAMYHEAFETDSDWQKWDSGCWIRYKMFENALASAPTIDAVPVVRCKDCKHYKFADNRAFGMPVKRCEWTGFEDVDDNDFCSRAERSKE